MASPNPNPSVDREWVAAEIAKGVEAEEALAQDARTRAEHPPDPSLQVLYHEIAAADERHRAVVEAVATRYGHTPSHGLGGSIGGTIGRLRDKVGEIGVGPMQRVSGDLASKANAIHWYTAWVQAFEGLGDAESARQLAEVLAEEVTHRDALQQGLNRMVAKGAEGKGDPSSGK